MRKKKKSNNNKYHLDENLINLTPLIDVVFVVLISFILIAPLLETDHVNLATSSINSDKSIAKSLVILKVQEDNSILLNNNFVNLSELTKILKDKKKFDPEIIPQLYHDKNAYFGTYQSVKNCVEAAGFDQMDVILKTN